MLKLLKNESYGIETVKANQKCTISFKTDKQMKMKRSEHDWRACASFSAIKWQESFRDFVVKLS